MSLLGRIRNRFKKKPLYEDRMFGDIKAHTFDIGNLMEVIYVCANGSIVIIDDHTWVQVFHKEDEE